MADNVTLNPGLNGAIVASDEILGVQYQRMKLIHGADGVNNGDVSTVNPFPVASPSVSPVDRSGTIATGGTAQVLMSANSSRRGFTLQNNSSGILYINITNGIASSSSLQISVGSLYESPENGCTGFAVSIFGATTGQAFYSAEW